MSHFEENSPKLPPLPADSNRREHARYEVTAYVDYTGSEVLLYHQLENISLGGICIRTSALEEIGASVELMITFPDQDEVLAIHGEVVWANSEPPRDMGIRFVDLDDQRRAVLRQYINAVDNRRRVPEKP
jgi:uncharacterized protein (TIGR02266 family)